MTRPEAELIDALQTAHGKAMDLAGETVTEVVLDKIDDLMNDIAGELAEVDSEGYA